MEKFEIIEKLKEECDRMSQLLDISKPLFDGTIVSPLRKAMTIEAVKGWETNVHNLISELKGKREKLSPDEKFKDKVLSADTKIPLADDEVVNKETPFFHSKVVLTGNLVAYPVREKLAATLKMYGADINTSISAKTNIVIVGCGAGPSKMRKVEELNEKGAGIRVIFEPEFLEIVEKYGIK